MSLALGAHGLPLFGTGDWNDGMNRVGDKGRGESVWLGWFLVVALDAVRSARRGARRDARALRWRTWAPTASGPRSRLAGTGLGTAAASTMTARRWDRPPRGMPNRPIAQSWSVLAGAAADAQPRGRWRQ